MEIKTRPINLEDKEQIDCIRRKYGHESSSHAFQSLYIWKEDMKLEIYIEEELFAVKCSLEREDEWFFPCGSKERIQWFFDQLGDEKISLRYMRQEDVELLEEIRPGKYEITEYPGDDEYLYSVEEQVALQGKKLRTVRNHISRVQRDHELRYEAISDDNMSEVMKVSEAWVRKSTENSSLMDVTASEYLLEKRKELDVSGVLVYVDEEPYAIVAGFPLSEKSFDMAMAKQVDTLSGLTTYAKYAMYNVLPGNYEIVNAEEDLDISGLRTMKQQMGPIGKILMFGAMPK
jgi:hypothetical protein